MKNDIKIIYIIISNKHSKPHYITINLSRWKQSWKVWKPLKKRLNRRMFTSQLVSASDYLSKYSAVLFHTGIRENRLKLIRTTDQISEIVFDIKYANSAAFKDWKHGEYKFHFNICAFVDKFKFGMYATYIMKIIFLSFKLKTA